MKQRAPVRGHLRNRRGATLVLVAMLGVVLFMFVGIAIDFGRMYAFKSQLQTRADAAAMAGIVDVQNGKPTSAPNSALAYLQLNPVEMSLAAVAIDTVEPGTYTTAGGFTLLGAWDANVTAVRVKAHYPAAYTAARIFGFDTLLLRSVGVAAQGYVGKTDCIKPIAMPYAQLLAALGKDPANTAYDLTAADVQTLATLSYANNLTFKPGTDTASNGIPGSFYIIDFPVIDTVNNGPINGGGTPVYTAGLAGCPPGHTVGPGDYLQYEQGVKAGGTKPAMQTLCGGGSNSQYFPSCVGGPVPIKMAIWDYTTNKFTGKNAVHIKYIGAFAITGYDGRGQKDDITGYFTTLITSGTMTSTPGPLKMNGLLVE